MLDTKITEQQELFLGLVRFGIGFGVNLNHNLNDNDLFEAVDWEAVKALAERQGLSAVVLDGIDALRCNVNVNDNSDEGSLKLETRNLKPASRHAVDSMPKMVRLQWIGEVLGNYEARFKAYEEAIGLLAGWYNAHGFKMMVLKGYACSLDWPRPEHRPTGDIDIWLFGEQARADAALSNENGVEIDNSHHHHTVFDWKGFMVENHYDFINVHAHRSSRELEKVFKELGKDDSHFVKVNGERVYLPSANLHALFLVRHMAAHFAGAEITLRQVLDWAFFVEKHGKDVDWKWLDGQLERFHMKEFLCCINAICIEDLGFDFRHTDSTDNTEIFGSDTNGSDGSLHLPSDIAHLKARVLGDILCPEFQGAEPRGFFARVVFKYRRWQANAWKQRLCYPESRWSTFWSGVWNHLLKPSSI